MTIREASSNVAIGEAFQIIHRGSADAMLAGCTGTRLNPSKVMHVALQEELASPDCEPAKASRPFDSHRTGMVLGEGAGAVILESLAAAKTRGATIYGEILAAASSCVAGRRQTRQSPPGARKRAEIAASSRRTEAGRHRPHQRARPWAREVAISKKPRRFKPIFGGRATPVPVVAVKSYCGNIGAAGGVVEMIASLMAMKHGSLFAALNHETPDPECPIMLPANGSTAPGSTFINLSVTPQGQASGILIRHYVD